MNKTYNIIRPAGLRPAPDKYEEKVAELCAEWFQSDILFVLRGSRTTPDIQVVKTGKCWEIKNIRVATNRAIEYNLRKANRQADCIIISLLRSSEVSPVRIISRIRYLLRNTNIKFSGILLVTKTGKIVDIKANSR